MTKLLLTIQEACDLTGLGRSNFYKLMKAGEIESVTIGKSRRIPAEALTEYVDRLRAAQTSDSPSA